MSLEVRAATEGDAGDIAWLNSDLHGKHVAALPWLFKKEILSAGAITSLLNADDKVLYVAEQQGEIAGYVYAQLREFPETHLIYSYTAFHIHHICVSQAARSKGVGTQLVEAMRDIARDKKVDVLTADYWAFNTEARALFTKCGVSPFLVRAWDRI